MRGGERELLEEMAEKIKSVVLVVALRVAVVDVAVYGDVIVQRDHE